MTTITEGRVTTTQAARRLGVTSTTLWRWWRDWHPHSGLAPGPRYGRVLLSPVDMMVARAWLAITDATRSTTRQSRHACRAAEQAIRRDPQPWLVVIGGQAATYPTAADAVRAWLAWRQIACRVIYVGEASCS